MVSKKLILWTLTLGAVVAVATTAIWQNQVRHLRKAVAAAEAKALAKKKKSIEPDDESPDKPAPAPKKAAKVTVLSPAAREHLAEQAFISALRTVFLWRSSQPQNPETSRVLLEKLSGIACEDLPAERKRVWRELLAAWKASAPQNEQAAETLNAMFKAHGDGDIML